MWCVFIVDINLDTCFRWYLPSFSTVKLLFPFGSKSFVGRSLDTGNNSSLIKLEPLLLASIDNPCLSKLLLWWCKTDFSKILAGGAVLKSRTSSLSHLSVWTHGFYLVGCHFAQMFPGLASGTFSGYFLCHLWHISIISWINTLSFSSTRCSRFISYRPRPSRNQAFRGEWCWETEVWVLILAGPDMLVMSTDASSSKPVPGFSSAFCIYACILPNSKEWSNIDTLTHFFHSYNSLELKILHV